MFRKYVLLKGGILKLKTFQYLALEMRMGW